jgi:uncharacterized lipoprotein
MKRILVLAVFWLFLNGCRYVNTKTPYLEAEESKPLEIPAGLDKPNMTQELEVPKAKTNNTTNVAKNIPPPEMPIRTKQSKKGDVRIENVEGYPELSVKTETEFMWQALNELVVENWTVKNANQDNCELILTYVDIEAQERENRGFIKKFFSRQSFYSDYSGDYKLTCKKTGSLVKTTFAKIDGTKAKSYLADSVMNALFAKFE